MNVQSAPVGVFDSGLGGLSIIREIQALLPGERLIYAADHLYCPYGIRSLDEIQDRSLRMLTHLSHQHVGLLVIACNTATAVVLEEARGLFDVPVIGLEPAVKPAVTQSENKKIGVLVTPRTATSDRLRRLIDRCARTVEVHIVPAPGLVELVESGELESNAAYELVADFIEPIVLAGVDTIVLGCTHYPFMRSVIQQVAGPGVTLIDSGEAVARRVQSLLDQAPHGTAPGRSGSLQVLTSGDPVPVSAIASRLLSREINAVQITVNSDDQAPWLLASPKLSAEWTPSTSALA